MSPKIYHYIIEVLPKAGSDKSYEFGGAYVNCWVKGEDVREVLKRIDFILRNESWIIKEIRKQEIIDIHTHVYSEDSLEYIQQAEVDGESFLVNTWPLKIQNEE